ESPPRDHAAVDLDARVADRREAAELPHLGEPRRDVGAVVVRRRVSGGVADGEIPRPAVLRRSRNEAIEAPAAHPHRASHAHTALTTRTPRPTPTSADRTGSPHRGSRRSNAKRTPAATGGAACSPADARAPGPGRQGARGDVAVRALRHPATAATTSTASST